MSQVEDPLLRDVLGAGALVAGAEGIRLMLEDGMSEQSSSRVQELFSRVEQLRLDEKLLLYLKLPMMLSNLNGTVDPLRQPLNPLGNRYEIQQTIMWIKTHLQEDPDVSLPKQEVYDEYSVFCLKNSMKPLSTADFGKVMKQVYPRVRPRRLGTRGNSRYCYAGMRKRIKLDPPLLPSTADPQVEDLDCDISEDMLGAASTLIREWAENHFNVEFPTLSALGKYLVGNSHVNSQSLAATCILSTTQDDQYTINKGTDSKLISSAASPVPMATSKTRKQGDAQLLLEKKHSNTNHVLEMTNTVKFSEENNLVEENRKSRKGKTHLDQDTKIISKTKATSVVTAAVISSASGRQRRVAKIKRQTSSVTLQSNCDNLIAQASGINGRRTTSPCEARSRDKQKRSNAHALGSVKRVRLPMHSPLDGEALRDYINGHCNSQDPEEELLQYFQQSNSSSSDAEPPRADGAGSPGPPTERGPRRRVSFEASPPKPMPIPPSPDTRRRIFDFTPISPSSTAGSPFASPRNTPVPRARGPSRSASCGAPPRFTAPPPPQPTHRPALPPVFLSELGPQLVINYPSQENLRELREGPNATASRSQSVPAPPVQLGPTPVPSEFTDFLAGESSMLDEDLFDMLTESERELSRSYPNTPFTARETMDWGSRSYPATPLQGTGEPMLYDPGTIVSMPRTCVAASLECSVAELLERDDLVGLGHFDGLQDVTTLSPLFTEVVESNH